MSEELPAEQTPERPHFVTPLTPVEHQVGAHVISALQHEATVAVLTTVMQGPNGQQNVVSIGLDPHTTSQVQGLIAHADRKQKQRVPCIGFHCFIDDDDDIENEETGDE